MTKKGYYFMLDAFFALGVVVIGILLIFGSSIAKPDKSQTINIADDILFYLADTKIQDLNNPYYGVSGSLVREGKIKDIQKSLLEQMCEFYYYYDLNNTRSLITNVTGNIIPFQYNYEFIIDGLSVYPENKTNAFMKSKNHTSLLFPSKKICFGSLNKTLELFGPYEVEVLVWQ